MFKVIRWQIHFQPLWMPIFLTCCISIAEECDIFVRIDILCYSGHIKHSGSYIIKDSGYVFLAEEDVF